MTILSSRASGAIAASAALAEGLAGAATLFSLGTGVAGVAAAVVAT